MKPISSDVVEKTFEKMGEMSLQEAQKFINRMCKEQPLMLAYLMVADEDILNQEERELLLYLGTVVWQIMLQGDAPLPKITEKILDTVEESNIKMLKYPEGESDAGFMDAVEKIMDNYSQPEVLHYVVDALMEEPEEGGLIRDENTGLMMLHLKTVIDCFSQ